jgi:hypothetical protein
MHCRQVLYLEGDDIVLCETHPWAPAEKLIVEDNPPQEAIE